MLLAGHSREGRYPKPGSISCIDNELDLPDPWTPAHVAFCLHDKHPLDHGPHLIIIEQPHKGACHMTVSLSAAAVWLADMSRLRLQVQEHARDEYLFGYVVHTLLHASGATGHC